MRKIRYLLGVMAVAVSVLFVAPTAAVAADGSVSTASNRSIAVYYDPTDEVHACDAEPNDGFGIWAQLSVQQANGSWQEKAPVTSMSGCNTGIRDVVRENARLRLVACDMQGGTLWNCRETTFNGG